MLYALRDGARKPGVGAALEQIVRGRIAGRTGGLRQPERSRSRSVRSDPVFGLGNHQGIYPAALWRFRALARLLRFSRSH